MRFIRSLGSEGMAVGVNLGFYFAAIGASRFQDGGVRWQSQQTQPHRNQGCKLSRDPNFLQKLTDVVGLYLNPPEKALVLCVDEKSQIQALDRTQPGLPLKKGRCGTMTHDYKRNGTTTLFAALEVAEGKVIGQCYARHRHHEFLKFLWRLEAEFPDEIKLHGVMDNLRHPQTPPCAALAQKGLLASFHPLSRPVGVG